MSETSLGHFTELRVAPEETAADVNSQLLGIGEPFSVTVDWVPPIEENTQQQKSGREIPEPMELLEQVVEEADFLPEADSVEIIETSKEKLDGTIWLFQQAQAGDMLAREQAILSNMRLVQHCAKRSLSKVGGTSFTIEDLVQIGTIGLIKAVDRFDAERKVRFATYAKPLIMGEISRAIRDYGYNLRPRRSVYDILPRVAEVRDRLKLAQSEGSLPTSIIAAEAEVEEKLAQEALEFLHNGAHQLSLEAPIEESPTSSICLADIIQNFEEDDPTAEAAYQGMLWHMIDKAVKDEAISGKQARLLAIMYPSDGAGVRTQEEVARIMGYSQRQISCLHKKAIKKLNEYFAGVYQPEQPKRKGRKPVNLAA